MYEFGKIDKLLDEARLVGNGFVSEGQHRKAFPIYDTGVRTIRLTMAQQAQTEGIKILFEPVPLLVNAAFCAAHVALQDVAKAIEAFPATSEDVNCSPESIRQHEVSLQRQLENLDALEPLYARLNLLGAEDAAAAKVDPGGPSSSVPPKYRTKDLYAKVFYRRAQVRWALSRLAFLRALELKSEATAKIAFEPLRHAVEAQRDFRACELVGGVAQTSSEYTAVRRYMFQHCNTIDSRMDKFISPIHGVGMVAAAAIPQGTLVLVERPAALVQGSAGDYEQRFIKGLEQVLALQKEAALKPGSRQHRLFLEYVALHGSPGTSDAPAAAKEGWREETKAVDTDLLCDVWRWNTIRLHNADFNLQERTLHSNKEFQALNGGAGLFLDASRMNHSCQPNCTIYLDLTALPRATRSYNVRAEVNIVTLRDIEAGEELVFSYTNPLAPREQRHEHLKFGCTCPLCGAADGKTPPEPAGLALEALVCPVCAVVAVPTTSSVKSKEDGEKGRIVSCASCEHSIELGAYLAGIQAVKDEAVVLTNMTDEEDPQSPADQGGRTESERRVTAASFLCKSAKQAKLLGPGHHLRFSLCIEALSCVAGLDPKAIEAELKADLMALCQETIKAMEVAVPAKWPTTAGLKMHLAYLLAQWCDRTEGEESNGSTAESDLKDLVSQAFESHCLLHAAIQGPVVEGSKPQLGETFAEDGTRLTSPVIDYDQATNPLNTFFVRFREELSSIGINKVEDFETYF